MQASQETSGYRAEMRATGGLAVWTLAWTASLALARFAPELWGDTRPAATWAAVVLNVLVGVGWIIAFTRYLNALDELQRKIMQDALAVTLGAAWVAGFGYVVAEAAGLVDEVSAAALPVFMSVVFLVAFAAGKIRYR
ncbi:hypothetical protein [Cellulomonas sp. P5_C5]